MAKLPAFQFYPADWLNDIALRACSFTAKGLLIDMMCLMHQSEEYGFLLINGRVLDDKELIKVLHLSAKSFFKYSKELLFYGRIERDNRGAYFCRRMVKDEALRTKRREAGKLGGNPVLVNQDVNQAPNQKSTPSSSSSSSSSSSKDLEDTQTKKTKYVFSDDDMQVALSLEYQMKQNNPAMKPITKSNLDSWANEVRLMEKRDKIPLTVIQQVLNWSQRDSFWKNNILSIGTFRKQFNKLSSKAKPVLPKKYKVGDECPECLKYQKEESINKNECWNCGRILND